MKNNVKRELREELKASGYKIKPNYLDESLTEKEVEEILKRTKNITFVKVYKE